MKKILSIITTALLFISSTSQAGLFMEGGLHFGGDELAGVTFVGGGSESVDAGGLLSFSVGYISDINDNIEIRTAFGTKFDFVTAENGDLIFMRFPLSIMLFNKGEKFSAGLGATYHMGPELDASSLPGGFNVDFDDALGFVAEIDYKFAEQVYLGLKATVIDYQTNNALGSASVDGNSLGIVMGVRF